MVILARWRNYLSQLFNVHGVNDIRQTEIRTVKLVPERSAFEVEMAIKRLKRRITRYHSNPSRID